MNGWLEKETSLMLQAVRKTLQKLKPLDPTLFRVLTFNSEPRASTALFLQVGLVQEGLYAIREDREFLIDRETKAVLVFDLDGVMLWLAGALSRRPVQMVTRLKRFAGDRWEPVIVYLGTLDPPRGYLFPRGYSFKDAWTSRELTPSDRPVFMLAELQPEHMYPPRLYSRATVCRMARDPNFDPTAIARVDLEASAFASFSPRVKDRANFATFPLNLEDRGSSTRG